MGRSRGGGHGPGPNTYVVVRPFRKRHKQTTANASDLKPRTRDPDYEPADFPLPEGRTDEDYTDQDHPNQDPEADDPDAPEIGPDNPDEPTSSEEYEGPAVADPSFRPDDYQDPDDAEDYAPPVASKYYKPRNPLPAPEPRMTRARTKKAQATANECVAALSAVMDYDFGDRETTELAINQVLQASAQYDHELAYNDFKAMIEQARKDGHNLFLYGIPMGGGALLRSTTAPGCTGTSATATAGTCHAPNCPARSFSTGPPSKDRQEEAKVIHVIRLQPRRSSTQG